MALFNELTSAGAPSGHGRRRALGIALAANGVFLLVEIAAGVLFSSLALLADAAHMASDVVGLTVALGAQWLVDRPASARHSYGFRRAEVLAAMLNGILLLVSAGWIVFEAARRIGDPVEVDGAGLLAVAMVGLVVNLGSAFVIARAAGRSLNMRGARLHMTADAASSIGAIAAGAAILLWDAPRADSVMSVVIAAIVVWAAGKLERETLQVLLEGAPKGLDPAGVEQAIQSQPDVIEVHHLHLWNISSEMVALSAHVVLGEDVSLHDAQLRGDEIRSMLAGRFAIDHATLELECHACEPVMPRS